MLNTSLSPWPSFSEEESEAAAAVIRSNRVNYWTGQECRKFEEEFAAYVGTDHAIALANGTLALELALRGMDIGPGDEVIVTPRTFIASISSVVTVGATPVFADVDPDSGNLSPDTIAAVLTPRTRAVVLVHLAGWPADMDGIMALADKHSFKVIEDCAQAHGAEYKGRRVGSIGHVAAWSFCQDKIMTTGGEGGMVTTNDKALWSRMWSYKDHGKSWEAVYEREHPPGFRWLHESFGSNYRMMEVQAAIGRIQLRRMGDWVAQRGANAQLLIDGLAAVSGPGGLLRFPRPSASDTLHANYKLYGYIRPERLAEGWSRDRIITEIVAAGVPVYQGSCSEVYLEKAFDGASYRPTKPLEVARQLGETSLMWLVHPTLQRDELARVAEVSASVLGQASNEG